MQPTIYIASKTKHAQEWKSLRDHGVPFCSSWIDFAGGGPIADKAAFCQQCRAEILSSDALLVYAEEGDTLEGALVEMGIALSVPQKPVYLVGRRLQQATVFTLLPQVQVAVTIEEALQGIKAMFSPLVQSSGEQ